MSVAVGANLSSLTHVRMFRLRTVGIWFQVGDCLFPSSPLPTWEVAEEQYFIRMWVFTPRVQISSVGNWRRQPLSSALLAPGGKEKESFFVWRKV